MSAALGSLEQAMYVATKEDTLWLQNVQRALHTRSKEHPDYVFEKLWGLVTDLRNLRIAFARVQRNRGARTAGIDRVTVRQVLRSGVMLFLDEIRKDLRGGTFRPARPARTHSQSRPPGEVSSPGHPDRERQGQKPPFFVATSTESPVRNERRTPGSERGARKPTRR